MEDVKSGKQALLESLSRLGAEDVALITAAIDQQVNGGKGELPHLGKLSRRFDHAFGGRNPDALAQAGAEAKTTLHGLFAASKAVQSARGDLDRAGLDDTAISALGKREETVKGLLRNLKELGVFVDGIHHCIGLQINPPRRKPHSEENLPLQKAITALAASAHLSPQARDYLDKTTCRTHRETASSLSR